MKRASALLVAGMIAVACGSAAQASNHLTVFAAASLTDSFTALRHAFQQQHPDINTQFSFAGTPSLVTQIEQGAQADVFASADTANMDRLQSDGFTAGTPQVFARNELEIAVAPGNPKGIRELRDLATPGLIYVTAGPTVPAGKYAAQALAKAGVSVTPKSLETDVRSVLSKIELGEADAGIVYTTDVKAAGDKVVGVKIPDQDNVVATYPIVGLKPAANTAFTQEFIAFVISSQGQATLESFGFLPA
jgi:molybdate transport system substrate-binding protein